MTRSYSVPSPLDGFSGTGFLPLRTSDPGGRPLISADRLLRRQLQYLSGETFISFALSGNGISLWAADDRGMRFHAAPATAAELMAHARRLLALCAEPGSGEHEVLAASRWLYQALIAPIEAVLDDKRMIHLHSAGDFPWIPFGLLRTERGEWLGDKYRLRMARNFPWHPEPASGETPNGDTASASHRPGEIRFLVVDAMPASTRPGDRDRHDHASPDRHGKIHPEEADGSAARLAALVPGGHLLQGPSANTEALLRQLPRAAALHLRCRALEGPGSAALQIPGSLDGPATSYAENGRGAKPAASNRIFPMETPPDWLAACQLAVLDVHWIACPGRNSPDGRVATLAPVSRKALALAMHSMGVPQVVAPLWNSGPEARACYFEAYYGAMAAGEDIEACERRAIAAVRKQRRWNHPHHWASFHCSTLHNLRVDNVAPQAGVEG